MAFALTGCIHQLMQPNRSVTLRRLELQDAPVFAEHGYEIVARQGSGVLKDDFNFDPTNRDDYGSATDVCYLLKKDKRLFQGCVYHGPPHPVFNVRPRD